MSESAETPTPLKMNKHAKPPPKLAWGLDKFLMTAKTIVSENYNDHRRPGQAKIAPNAMFVVWYTTILQSWKAVISSPAAKDLRWEVTYDGDADVVRLEFFKKFAFAEVPMNPIKEIPA